MVSVDTKASEKKRSRLEILNGSVRYVLCLAIFCFFAGVIPANSHTVRIEGFVNDPSAIAVANATLSLENVQKHSHYLTTTNSQGLYMFSGLEPGTYMLHAQAEGFDSSNDVRVVVTSGEAARNFTIVRKSDALNARLNSAHR
jgi:Carboxypeptidase regulatory-like domain